ncbi:unnamed protein product [Cunninghamella echinulata]
MIICGIKINNNNNSSNSHNHSHNTIRQKTTTIICKNYNSYMSDKYKSTDYVLDTINITNCNIIYLL